MTDIFSSPDVTEVQSAPGALEQPVFMDIRGTINRINLDGFKVNLLSTKKGFMRSGDLHKNTQFDFIFSGKLELWLRKDGKDVKTMHGPNSFITIPPGIPHLFNFLEDTVMAEWWDTAFKAWYYKPYRDIIDAQSRKMTGAK